MTRPLLGVANGNPASTFSTNIEGTWNLQARCRSPKGALFAAAPQNVTIASPGFGFPSNTDKDTATNKSSCSERTQLNSDSRSRRIELDFSNSFLRSVSRERLK